MKFYKFIILLVIISFQSIMAHDKHEHKYDPKSVLPLDSTFTIGKLENGLTYYIKENDIEDEAIELRLVVKAGSILEDEDQRGLAHFIEHMAFNGTKNFKKNELVHYLQTIGVRFGADLNAYTSFDETVYILPIPVTKKEYFDKGLQILRDWAGDVTFDEEEIEKERGVVLEEWRSSLGAQTRMANKTFPKIFYKSKYAERLPIGKVDIIKNADKATITRFYKDWYRPNLMAVVVCGKVSTKQVETRIKELFSDLTNPSNERPRIEETLPNHKEVIISKEFDKELVVGQFSILHKLPKRSLRYHEDYKRQLTNSLFNSMISARFSEITRKSNPPFLGAGCSISDQFLGGTSMYGISTAFGKSGFEKALIAVLKENERAKRFGFLQQELQNAKNVILQSYEHLLKEKNKHSSVAFADEMKRHFLIDEAMPGIDYEYEITKYYLNTITVEEINNKLSEWITKENRVITLNAPSADSLSIPSEKRIIEMVNTTTFPNLKSYQYEEVKGDLMTNYILPQEGSIIDEKYFKKVGVYQFKLSNGAKVFAKPTSFKNDEIVFSATSEGGMSVYTEKDYTTLSRLEEMMSTNGLNSYNKTNLEKIMSDKSSSVGAYIDQYNEGLTGGCTPKDFKTMFEQIHLNMTKVYWDKEAINAQFEQNKMIFPYLENNPEVSYYIDMLTTSTMEHPLLMKSLPKLENYENIDIDRAEKIYYERFADASSFSFCFAGNFTIDEIKPFIIKYIASLPSIQKEEKAKDLKLNYPKGIIEKTTFAGVEEKSKVNLIFNGEIDNKKGNLGVFYKSLENRLLDILREDKGGVYGVRVNNQLKEFPKKEYSIQVIFGCDPKRKDELISTVFQEIKSFQEEGISDEEFKRVIETKKEGLNKASLSNGTWVSKILSANKNNKSINGIKKEQDKYLKQINKLKKESVQIASKSYINLNEYQLYVLMPKAYEK